MEGLAASAAVRCKRQRDAVEMSQKVISELNEAIRKIDDTQVDVEEAIAKQKADENVNPGSVNPSPNTRKR